jgi:hypothetical protein
MAITRLATTIVCDAGPNTVPGPIEIQTIVCAGAVTVALGGTTFLTLPSGVNYVEFRSTKDITVTGACTLLLCLE